MSCIWDRDTLHEEAAGKGKIVQVMVGWFDRYPPKYYEMRLDRVQKEIETTPNNLSLYDDAAVALERLGRSEEAITLMARKKSLLNAMPASEEKTTHTYRYFANMGTFHAHAWFALGETKRLQDTTHIDKAEKFIEAAIKLNPDAHFGREKYQLMAIRWLNPSHKEELNEHVDSTYRASLMALARKSDDPEKAIEGLTGLIRLGAAWRSIDVYAALAECFTDQEHSSLVYLAQLRIAELHASGANSAHYDAGVQHAALNPGRMNMEKPEPVAEWYGMARAKANKRHLDRTRYIEDKLAAGQHPDTHSDFWDGWQEPEFPKLHYTLMPKDTRGDFQPILIWGGSAIGGVVLLLGLLKLRKGKS